MSLHFYAYARKGYEFIDAVAHELKTTDTDKAGRLSRCVIRALRNRLTLDESFSLLAQLPMALKGVYVDGWKFPSPSTEKMNLFTDFVTEVIKEDDNSAWRDFSNEEEVKEVILAVFKVLSHHIVASEFENIMVVLPSDLQYQLKADLKVTLKN